MLPAAVRTGDPTAAPERTARKPAPSGTAAGAIDQLAHQVVEAMATAGEPAGGWRPLEVRLRARNGWHLNADPASEDFLIPPRPEGELQGVRYPPGKPFLFAFSERPLDVYAGEETLRGKLAAGANGVTLTYQACDQRGCLPPVSRPRALDHEEHP